MNALYNLARATTATTGTGTITLGSAASGYLTFAQAGVPDGAIVTYAIEDANGGHEVGRGTYTASGTTLSRDEIYRSTGSGNNTAISLSGSAQVFITAAREDFPVNDISNTPHVYLDFATPLYWDAPNNPGNPLTITRASAGYIDSIAGVWSSVATGALRRSDKGALIEEARTNSLRNNSMTGAAAGAPGTAPAGWVIAAVPTGLTRTIALGTTNGVEYTELNYSGTATSTAAFNLVFETTSVIASVNGDIWADSCWMSNAASTGITTLSFQHLLDNSGGTFLAAINVTTGLLNASWARIGSTVTNNNASTAFVRCRLLTNTVNSGTVVNFTVRIGWPMMEKVTDTSFTYSSPIRTTAAAATRAADVVSVNLPPSFGTAYSILGAGSPQYATAYNADQYLASISDGSATNRFGLLRLAATGVPQWIINSTKTAIGAAAWAQSTAGVLDAGNAVSSQGGSFNGSAAPTTGTSATSPTALTTLAVGHDGTGAGQWNGYITRIACWPGTRLDDSVLRALAAGTRPGGLGFVTALDYGSTTNDNAAAGRVGEFLSAGSLATSMTSTVAVNIASIALTAGDWDVEGFVKFNPAGTTTSTIREAGLSQTTGTLPTALEDGTAWARESGAITTGTGSIFATGCARISLATTTTIYLVGKATFATSTMTADGYIKARRRR